MRSIVVLMYHRIGEARLPEREPGEGVYTISADAFESQLEALAQGGGLVLPFEDLESDRRPARGVVLTFDDGNDSDLAVAAPALARRGYRGIFFITPAWVGLPGNMSWAELKELQASGMTLGAHGLDHTLLSTLPDGELEEHLREARRLLEAGTGRAPDYLSLPGGAGGHRAVQAALQVGFRRVATSVPGRFRRGQAVPRYAVRQGDSAASVRALVEQKGAAIAAASMRSGLVSAARGILGERMYQGVRAVWAGTRTRVSR